MGLMELASATMRQPQLVPTYSFPAWMHMEATWHRPGEKCSSIAMVLRDSELGTSFEQSNLQKSRKKSNS